MEDLRDPAEIAADAARQGDNGEMGAAFTWGETPLRPYSLHHKNALHRLAWDNMTDQEYSGLFLWLLTRTGEQVNGIRTPKEVAAALFDATEWAAGQKAHKPEVAKAMLETVKKVKADHDAAESLAPVSRGGSRGNA